MPPLPPRSKMLRKADLQMDDVEHGLELSGKLISELNLMSTDDIASLMCERGIKGKRAMTYSCAVAAYLNQEVSQYGIAIRVSGEHIYADTDGCRQEEYANSENLTDFIMKFDTGHFPHLFHTL
jgi:hypothetical protein